MRRREREPPYFYSLKCVICCHYMSKTPSPVIVLIADGTNYVCTDQGQDRGFLKRLDVDGIISPRRDNEDAAGPPVFESFFHGKNGDATKFLNIIKRMTSGKPFRPWRTTFGHCSLSTKIDALGGI